MLCIDDALLDVRSETVEGLLDVDIRLCGDFEEGDIELVGECLALFCRYGTLLFPVAFVAYENLVDALGGVLLDVGKPSAYVCEILPCQPGSDVKQSMLE